MGRNSKIPDGILVRKERGGFVAWIENLDSSAERSAEGLVLYMIEYGVMDAIQEAYGRMKFSRPLVVGDRLEHPHHGDIEVIEINGDTVLYEYTAELYDSEEYEYRKFTISATLARLVYEGAILLGEGENP